MKVAIGVTVVEALQLDDAGVCKGYADGIAWSSKGISETLIEVRGSREAITALMLDCERWASQGGEWDNRYAAACKRAEKALCKALERRVLVSMRDEDGTWYRVAGEGDCWTNAKRDATQYLPGTAAAIIASLKAERKFFSLAIAEAK